MLLTAEITEEANKKLLTERYYSSILDGIENSLIRAKGISGLLVDVAVLIGDPNARHDPNPSHIEHTSRALQLEINDALTLLNDLYEQERVAAGHGGANE